MNKEKAFDKNNTLTIIYLLISIWFLINIILFPQNCIHAASKGLITWFNIIIPSLFPFFVISELLIGLGFVDFIGVLLEPLMIPIFNVPGKGAFPFAMSITSGYPMGVKLVSNLRKNQSLTKTEAQRLLSFCSTSGPLFMIGAVSSGMLNNSHLSPLILFPHYLGALTVGIIFRNYNKGKKINYLFNRNIFHTAFNKLFESRKKNNKTIGTLLSESVKNSLSSILVIGGFMIFYSVLVETLNSSNFFNIVTKFLNKILSINADAKTLKGIITGIFEITIGCSEIAELKEVSLLFKILTINFLIGWSGFSVHSQALSFISNTDLNGKLYVLSKLLHGLLASAYSYIIYILKYKNALMTSFNPQLNSLKKASFAICLTNFKFSIKLGLYALSFTLLYGIIIGLINIIAHNK